MQKSANLKNIITVRQATINTALTQQKYANINPVDSKQR
jgi:hypothetical protein